MLCIFWSAWNSRGFRILVKRLSMFVVCVSGFCIIRSDVICLRMVVFEFGHTDWSVVHVCLVGCSNNLHIALKTGDTFFFRYTTGIQKPNQGIQYQK